MNAMKKTALLGALILSFSANASLRLSVAPCNQPTNRTFSDGIFHSIQNSCDYTRLGIQSGGSSSAGGQASSTVLKLDVSTNSYGFGRPQAEADIQVSDYLKFSVENYQGAVNVTYLLSVDANTLAVAQLEGGYSVSASSRWSFVSQLGSDTSGMLSIQVSNSALVNPEGSEHFQSAQVNGEQATPIGLFSVTARVPANQNIWLRHRLQAFAIGGEGFNGYGTTIANADLGNSVYWAGISSVVGADGQAINYSLTSLSGVDYGQSYIPAIPEPNTALAFSAGLLALAIARRRGHSPAALRECCHSRI